MKKKRKKKDIKQAYRIPQPIGGGRQTNAARADGQREDLADDDPGARTPGRGEEEDKDTDKGDLGVDGARVDGGTIRVLLVEADGDADDGDDELTEEHAKGPPDEQGPASEALDGVEGDRGRADVDEGEDERDQEGVFDAGRGLEEGGRIVEDEIHAGPLLHHLERGPEDGPSQVAARLPETAAEALHPARKVAGGRNHLSLVLGIGHDLGQLGLDVLGRGRLAT